jgi:hypothetical protein
MVEQIHKFKFHYFNNEDAVRMAPNAAHEEGDIVYVESTEKYALVRPGASELLSQIGGWSKQFILDLRSAPDTDDVLARYADVIADPRPQSYFRVRIGARNCSLIRMFDLAHPDRSSDRHLLSRYENLTLSYETGRLITIHVTYWRMTIAEIRDKERAAYKHVRMRENSQAKLTAALEEINNHYLEISEPQASLVLMAVFETRLARFEANNCNIFVGKSSTRMPPSWRPESSIQYNNRGLDSGRTCFVTLHGPAKTRRKAYDTLCAASRLPAPVTKRVISFTVLNYFPPPERECDMEKLYSTLPNAQLTLATAADTRNLVTPAAWPAKTIYGYQFRWPHQCSKLIDIAIALCPLLLPAYVVTWVLDWLDEPYVWRSTEAQRVELLQGVATSRKKVFTKRAERQERLAPRVDVPAPVSVQQQPPPQLLLSTPAPVPKHTGGKTVPTNIALLYSNANHGFGNDDDNDDDDDNNSGEWIPLPPFEPVPANSIFSKTPVSSSLFEEWMNH